MFELVAAFVGLTEYNSMKESYQLLNSQTEFVTAVKTLDSHAGSANPIGIARLHKHYELSGKEVPVWQNRDNSWVLEKADLARDTMPVTWKISHQSLMAVEFVRLDHTSKENYAELINATRNIDLNPLLNEWRKNYIERFDAGLTILPNLMRQSAVKSDGSFLEIQSSPESPPVTEWVNDFPKSEKLFKFMWEPQSLGWTLIAGCMHADF